MSYLVVLAALFCISVVVPILLVLRMKRKQVKGIPVVNAPSLFSAIIGNGKSPFEIFKNILKYDGIFQSRIASDYMVFVAKPDLVQKVLTTVVAKGWLYEQTSFFPNIHSIFSSDTAESKKIRPLFSPSFSINNINQVGNNCIKAHSKQLCDLIQTQIRGGKQPPMGFNLDNFFSALTIDVICTAGFNYNIGALAGSSEYTNLVDSMHLFMAGMRKRAGDPILLLSSIAKTAWDGIRSKMGVDVDLNKKMSCCGGSGNNSEAILQTVAESIQKHISETHEEKHDDSGKKLPTIADGILKMESDKENFNKYHVLGNILTFFIAGHDTTAHSLSFLFFLLALNEEVQAKAQLSVDEAYPDKNQDTDPNNIPDYIDAVIKESMRRFPVAASGSFRQVIDPAGFQLGDYHLPKGTWLATPLYSIHNWDKIWGDASEFRPERWLNANEPHKPVSKGLGAYSGTGMNADKSDLTFIPFSAGPRNCVGMTLAINEMKIATVDLVRRFRFKLSEETLSSVMTNGKLDDEKVCEDAFTLRPLDVIRVIVEER